MEKTDIVVAVFHEPEGTRPRHRFGVSGQKTLAAVPWRVRAPLHTARVRTIVSFTRQTNAAATRYGTNLFVSVSFFAHTLSSRRRRRFFSYFVFF